MVSNKGRLINFISGITGVVAGGNGLVNLPVNQRYHRLILNTQCVNYTGGTGLATTKITGAGNNDLTVTPTVVNGVVTAVAVVAGGTGYTTGDTVTITDATGVGFIGTVTADAGVVTAVAVTNGGTASNADPTQVITSIQQLVNGVPVRDIEPDHILRYVMAQGYYPNLGELPLLYTNPQRNKIQRNDVTSWDLFGQSTFSLKFNISATASQPSVTGSMEFDFLRNVRMENNKEVVFLEPTAQHQYGFSIAAGRNDITTLPFDFPISRLWFLGSSPGNITQIEIYQDGNKWFEATTQGSATAKNLANQMAEMYQPYGFTFGRPDWLNTSRASSNTLKAAYANPRYYDAAFISDADGRWSKRLSVANALTVRVYSSVAQNLTIMSETMPGAYA